MADAESLFFCGVVLLMCVSSIEAATLGQACNATKTCTGENVVCSYKICACATYYQPSSTGNDCFIGLSGQCPNGALDTCIDSNAMCTQVSTGSTNFSCQCTGSYFRFRNTCMLKKPLGYTCSSSLTVAQCADGNAVCVQFDGSSSTGTCQCKAGFYDSNGESLDGTCVRKIGLSGTCPNPRTTGVAASESCSESRAVCEDSGNGFRCLCSNGYYENSRACIQKVELNNACTTTSTCTTDNAVCANGQCSCQVGYYDSNGATPGGSCNPKMALGTKCHHPDVCGTPNAVCSNPGDGTCVCGNGFYDDNGNTQGGKCLARKYLGQGCTEHDVCEPFNSVCGSGSACVCPNDYYDTNGDSFGGNCLRKVELGYSCPQPDACSTFNSYCKHGKCVCSSSYYDSNRPDNYGGSCVLKVGLGEACPRPDACNTSNAVCSISTGGGTCVCSSAYYDDNRYVLGGNCQLKVQLGSRCGMPTACATTNSVCLGNVCQCRSSYYDSNGAFLGGSCQNRLTLNSQCSLTAINTYYQQDQCLDGNAECLNSSTYTCTCRQGYHQTGSNCVLNSYGDIKLVNGTNEFSGSILLRRNNEWRPVCDDAFGVEEATVVCRMLGFSTDDAKPHCCTRYGYPDGVSGFWLDDLACTGYETSLWNCQGSAVGTHNCRSSEVASVVCHPHANIKLANGSDEFSGSVLLRRNNEWRPVCDDSFGTQEATVVCRMLGYSTEEAKPYCCNKYSYSASTTNFWLDDLICTGNESSLWNCPGKAVGTHDCGLGEVASVVCQKPLGERCYNNTDCSDSHAACIASKCTCDNSHYDSNGLSFGGRCMPVSNLQVTGITFSAITTYSIAVSWIPPSVSSHINAIVLTWGPITGTGSTSTRTFSSPSTVASTMYSQINPGRAYRITILSRNSQTQQGSNRETVATAYHASKPVTPSSPLQHIDMDASDKLITFRLPAINYSSGFDVKLFDNSVLLEDIHQTNIICTIYNTNLLSGHRYNITIVARSEVFPYGNNHNAFVSSGTYKEQIKTAVKAPGPPESPWCSDSYSFYIILKWLSPSYFNGDFVKYHIEVYKQSYPYSAVAYRSTSNIDKNVIYRVDQLQPGSSYFVRIKTENELYNSSTISLSYCRTVAATPGTPTNLTVTEVTSRTMTVSWGLPEITDSEEILGYILQMKDNSNICVREQLFVCQNCSGSFWVPSSVLCVDTVRETNTSVSKQKLYERQLFTITGLLPDIEYTVSVSAVNQYGQGNISYLLRMSDEEEPQMPRDVSVTDIQQKTMIISWNLPGPRPGSTNFTILLTADNPAASPIQTVQGLDKNNVVMGNLEENWSYSVSVTASTSKGNATAYSSVKYRTKQAAPGPVDALSVETPEYDVTKLQVSWRIPTILERNGNITGYVFVNNATGTEKSTDVDFVSEAHVYKETVPVVPGNYYFFRVYAKNSEGDNGVATTKIVQAPTTGTMHGGETIKGDSALYLQVGGSIGGGVVLTLIVVIVGFTIYWKKKHGTNPMSRLVESSDALNADDCLATPKKRPMQLSEFPARLENMHRDLNMQFSLIFEDLKSLSPHHKQSVANAPKNKVKNRDVHVLPFDHARVKLRGKDDYINASYLPGYRSPREYIGCQGPLPVTLNDFWRMVWEQNVSAVVMLTLCKELDEVKCEQYWPRTTSDPIEFGDVTVEVASYTSFPNYDHRVFKLVCNGRRKTLEHFHYLGWLNMKTNYSLLDFILNVRRHVKPTDTTRPMIVHCSSGAGRTGIYIILDHLMQFIEGHGFGESIDIFDMVLNLRENRPHMVQTEQQYVFIHGCVNTILERKMKASSQSQNNTCSDENVYQNQVDNVYEMLTMGK